MLYEESIKNFPNQLLFSPKIANAGNLPFPSPNSFIVAGTGGSALAADILKVWEPELDLVVHRDYELPPFPKEKSDNKKYFFVASSYSGNTEETLDAFEEALRTKLSVAAISTGGELLKRAREEKIPYIQMPDTGIRPRSAIGFNVKSLLAIMRKEDEMKKLEALSARLSVSEAEKKGREIAENLHGYFPVIYSSNKNAPIARGWKTYFNETGKIAAYTNVFPELNHNEIMGFDFTTSATAPRQPFLVIMLEDKSDHPRVMERMRLTANLYRERKIPVINFILDGESVWEKIFSALLVANWASYYTAKNYRFDAEEEKTVEEFKKTIKRKRAR